MIPPENLPKQVFTILLLYPVTASNKPKHLRNLTIILLENVASQHACNCILVRKKVISNIKRIS